MATVVTRQRGNPSLGDDASVPTAEDEFALPEPAPSKHAQTLWSRVPNLDVDDHMGPLAEAVSSRAATRR